MNDFDKYCEIIFWSFERKNNVIYNFQIINGLITDARKNKNTNHYYKPIFILMMAVIECVLYDFLCRIKQEVHEGLNLSKNERSIIRRKNLPKQLKCYVDICRKHKLLGSNKPDVYEALYRNLEVRNRVHIQNLNNFIPQNESDLWNQKKVKSCGSLLQYIFQHICNHYPRPERFHTNPDLKKFPTPWDGL